MPAPVVSGWFEVTYRPPQGQEQGSEGESELGQAASEAGSPPALGGGNAGTAVAAAPTAAAVAALVAASAAGRREAVLRFLACVDLPGVAADGQHGVRGGGGGLMLTFLP